MRASISFSNPERHIHYVMNTNAHFIKKAKYIRIASTLVKVLVITVLALYVLFTYSRVGLFLWEIAPIFSMYLITPVLVGYIALVKFKQKKKNHKQEIYFVVICTNYHCLVLYVVSLSRCYGLTIL